MHMDLHRESLRLRSLLSAGSRALGIALLAGMVLAACGDDDDDVDLGNDDSPTAVMITSTPANGSGSGDPTATLGSAADPTASDDAAGDATRDDASPTQDDADATSVDDGTATSPDSAATGTEGSGTNATTPSTGTADHAHDGWRGREARVGEPIRVDDDLTITVESVEDATGIPGVVEPDAGNRFIAIELTVENADDDPLTAIELFNSLRVATHDGSQWFEIDPLVTASLLQNRDAFDQDIGRGQSVTGSVAFEVPAEDNDLYLILNDDDDEDWDEHWGDDDLVRVDLSEELSR